jgi:hypothetical protein
MHVVPLFSHVVSLSKLNIAVGLRRTVHPQRKAADDFRLVAASEMKGSTIWSCRCACVWRQRGWVKRQGCNLTISTAFKACQRTLSAFVSLERLRLALWLENYGGAMWLCQMSGRCSMMSASKKQNAVVIVCAYNQATT